MKEIKMYLTKKVTKSGKTILEPAKPVDNVDVSVNELASYHNELVEKFNGLLEVVKSLMSK